MSIQELIQRIAPPAQDLRIEVGALVRFHRVVRDRRDEQEYVGVVERIEQDGFGEWWMHIAYRSRRWGNLYYAIPKAVYDAYLNAGEPLVTGIARGAIGERVVFQEVA